MLDVGAGTGSGGLVRENLPEVRYRSVDVSEYACKTYGHEKRDIGRWRAREKFDLVVCQGVLPYLEDAACGVPSPTWRRCAGDFSTWRPSRSRDLREVVDRSRRPTSRCVRVRRPPSTGASSARHFERLGCGLHHVKGGDKLFYDLESA